MKLSRRALLALAGIAWPAPAILLSGGPARASIGDAIDARARVLVRGGHAGLAVAVVPPAAGGEPPVVRTYGVRDARGTDRVGGDTIFRIASITKVVTGVALLQLRDAGALGLDDPVARWLPEARALPPMTLRHLVTHTSGLPRDVPAGGTSEEALLAKLAWVKPASPPGRRTAYSNFAMALAGPIIRRASGVPYRQWMHDRVLAPLGMASAGWERAELPAERVATGNLVTRDETGVHARPSLSEWRMGAAEAFGGLYASVEDMVRFARFELTGVGPLSAASLAESQTPAIEVPGEGPATRYGVCWRLEVERGLARHGGATDEYGAAIAIDRRKGAAAILLSTAPFAAELEAAAAVLLSA